MPVAIALTTTALGALLPILRDQNMLRGVFGRSIAVAAALGAFCRIGFAVHLVRR